MSKEKFNNTSEEVLSHITHNLNQNNNLTKNLVEDIRHTETEITTKLQKTSKDLQKFHYLNEQEKSEKQNLEVEILNAKEKCDLYCDFYRKIYDILPIQENRIRDMEKENSNFGSIIDKIIESRVSIEKENLAMKEDFKEFDQTKAVLEKDISRLLDELSSSAGEINSLKHLLSIEKNKFHLLQTDYDHLQEDHRRIQQENDVFKQTNQTIVNDRDKILEQLNKVISDQKDLENNFNELNNKKSGAEISFNMQISKKDNEIKSLNEQIVDAKNEINKLTTSCRNLEELLDQKDTDVDKIIEDNEDLQGLLRDAEKKFNEVRSKHEIYFDRSEAQITNLKDKLAKNEKLLIDARMENQTLQMTNEKLNRDEKEMSREKSNLDLQLRKMQLDLNHRLNSSNDPFDKLKYPILEHLNNQEDGTPVSLSRNPSFDSSIASEVPEQIRDILEKIGDEDVDEDFHSFTAPPSSQDEETPFRLPLLTRKRKIQGEEHIVPLSAPSTSGTKRKVEERKYLRSQVQNEKFSNRNLQSQSKRRKEELNPEISSSVPESPYDSPL